MEITEMVGAATGVGGAGVLARAILPKLVEAHKERMADKLKAFEANQEAVSKARKFFQPVALSTGAFVHRGFAICAFIILMAPIILPFFGDVVVHYYWPKDLDFFIFETTRMKAIVCGTENFDPKTGASISTHVMILPIHITAAMNVLSFYLTGKALK
jgi:hypothetical protein